MILQIRSLINNLSWATLRPLNSHSLSTSMSDLISSY